METTISMAYQIVGFNPEIYPIRKETMDETIKKINTDRLYSRADIETLSATFGYSIYDCFLWNRVKVIEREVDGVKETFYEGIAKVWKP